MDVTQHNKDGLHPVDLDGWIDIGCPDLNGASENRGRITNHENIEAYLIIETLIKKTNYRFELPPELIGVLPQVGKHQSRNREKEE